MKRNYLLFCNHIAFCSIGILAVLIIGTQNADPGLSSEWPDSSDVFCMVSNKNNHREISEDISLNQWKTKDDPGNRMNPDQNLEQSFFPQLITDFLPLSDNNISVKTQYFRLSDCSKYFLAITSLLDMKPEINSISFLQLKSDLLRSEKAHKQLKGFVIVVKIPDKIIS